MLFTEVLVEGVDDGFDCTKSEEDVEGLAGRVVDVAGTLLLCDATEVEGREVLSGFEPIELW